MNALQKDFQETLQAAALQYLQRHQSEHLGDDHKLLDRAALFLINDFGVLEHTAEKVVSFAANDLTAIRDRQRMDLANSTSTHSVIVDPETGVTWAIPVSLIFERLVGSPDSTRYRVANT